MDYSLFDKYLGEQLQEKRLEKRMTQEVMAKLISQFLINEKDKKKGISQQAYAFYENGQRSMPSSVFHYACFILGLNEVEAFEKANKKFMANWSK